MRAFSSEVDTGSPQENASNKDIEPPFRFHRNGNGSRTRPDLTKSGHDTDVPSIGCCPGQDTRHLESGNAVRRDDALKRAYRFEILLAMLGFCCAWSSRARLPQAAAPAHPPGAGAIFVTRAAAANEDSHSNRNGDRRAGLSNVRCGHTTALLARWKRANSAQTGRSASSGSAARWLFVESPSRSIFFFKHDLFGKPVSTFPDHALVAETTIDRRGDRRDAGSGTGRLQD